jgi:hypothetical protein
VAVPVGQAEEAAAPMEGVTTTEADKDKEKEEGAEAASDEKQVGSYKYKVNFSKCNIRARLPGG